METDYQRIPESMHHKSCDKNMTSEEKKRIKASVRVVLNAIRESKFAYNADKNMIDFEIAMQGLSSKTYDDLIAITSNFKNLSPFTQHLSDMVFAADILCACYNSIHQLKYVPRYGREYYDIVTRYYINKEFKNPDSAADAFNIKIRTLYRYLEAAMFHLHTIWNIVTPKDLIELTEAIHTQLSL